MTATRNSAQDDVRSCCPLALVLQRAREVERARRDVVGRICMADRGRLSARLGIRDAIGSPDVKTLVHSPPSVLLSLPTRSRRRSPREALSTVVAFD